MREESVVVELAGVPIEIRCRNQKNIEFLRDYITEKIPLLHCLPSDGDLERMRMFCSYLIEQGEMANRELTDEYIENITIEAEIADLLVPFGTLQFHGSAICMDGEVYIFTAPSGTGKSTHTRLWRQAFGTRAFMINDDKPLVRVCDGRAVVYGSPWDGKHGLSRNTSAPLKAIVALYRGTDNRIERITSAEAFPVVFRQAHTSADPEMLTRIMRLEQQLLSRTACYRLYCNMESDAAMVAWKGMNSFG